MDWTYKQVEFDVSDLKNESANAWNNSVSLPIGTNGANTNIAWEGCIEERKTLPLTDSDPSDDWDPIPDEALDMDIDTVPDSSDPDTLWGPLLTGAVWLREDGSGNNTRRCKNQRLTVERERPKLPDRSKILSKLERNSV